MARANQKYQSCRTHLEISEEFLDATFSNLHYGIQIRVGGGLRKCEMVRPGVPSPANVTLSATSVADGTKSATVTITITAAPAATIAVTLSNDGNCPGQRYNNKRKKSALLRRVRSTAIRRRRLIGGIGKENSGRSPGRKGSGDPQTASRRRSRPLTHRNNWSPSSSD